MRQRAGRAIHRLVGIGGFFGGHLIQPVLHVHAGPGAFEDDMAGHGPTVSERAACGATTVDTGGGPAADRGMPRA